MRELRSAQLRRPVPHRPAAAAHLAESRLQVGHGLRRLGRRLVGAGLQLPELLVQLHYARCGVGLGATQRRERGALLRSPRPGLLGFLQGRAAAGAG